MSKKKGLFSWLRRSTSETQDAEQTPESIEDSAVNSLENTEQNQPQPIP